MNGGTVVDYLKKRFMSPVISKLNMDKKSLASHLDLANHHPDAQPGDIRKLCRLVSKFGFNSAFVNPCYVKLARGLLTDNGKVGTVVSFPIGQDSKNAKILAAIDAAKKGVSELDVSMNVGWFKAGDQESVLSEMKAVVEAAGNVSRTVVIKFIIETGFLTDGEIKKASELVLESGADFVKTCSGWGPRGAKVKDVELIRAAVGTKIKVKVAGGIRDYQKAVEFINAGADRIGTSKAVEILKMKKLKLKGGEGE